MGVPYFGIWDEVIGTRGDHDEYIQVKKNGGAVRIYLPNNGPMPSYREEAGIEHNGEVVG